HRVRRGIAHADGRCALEAATEGSLFLGVFARLSGCVSGEVRAGGDGEVPWSWTLRLALGVRLGRASGGRRRELVSGRGRFAARRPVVGSAEASGCPRLACFFLCALDSGGGT